MREQLSTILGHVQELSKLDLGDVLPTAHALDLANSVRADRSRPSWPRETSCGGPGSGGRRLRGAANGMIDTSGLSAERCVELLDAREVSCRELVDGVPRPDRPRKSCAPRLPAHAPRRRAPEADARDRDGRSGLEASRSRSRTSSARKGEETTAGSRILEGHVPIYDGGCVTASRAPGSSRSAKRTWTSSRWARRPRTRRSGSPATLGSRARARRLVGRLVGGGRGRASRRSRSGTDTGGSIRQPAALCGVVGIKPTYGPVSRYGLIAFASSLDQIGPFALTVRDCALLLQVIAATTRCDATSVELPEPIVVPDAGDLRGVRDRRAGRAAGEGIEPEIRAAVHEAVAPLSRAGRGRRGHAAARADTRCPPTTSSLPPRRRPTSRATTACATAPRRGGEDTVIEMFGRTRAEGFGAKVKRRIMLGTYALSAGYYDAYYGRRKRCGP